MNRRFGVGFAALLLVLGGSGDAYSYGASTPPPAFPYSGNHQSNIERPPATHVYLGDFEVVLEETVLSQVKRKFPSGIQQRRGDASNSEVWLCYTARGKVTDERIWLIASEMDGRSNGEFAVGAVAIEAVPDEGAVLDGCPLLPARYGFISLDGGVAVGMKREVLVSRLGPPASYGKSVLSYFYVGTTKLTGHDAGGETGDRIMTFDVTSSVTVQVEHNRVIRLWADKTTSN